LWKYILLTNMANNQNLLHNYKYLELKTRKLKEDIKFNKMCLSKNVTPNYIQIKTKAKSRAAIKALQIAKKVWIKEEINSLYAKMNFINVKKEKMYEDILSTYHNETVEEYMIYVENWIRPFITKKTKIHSNKINRLISLQKDEFHIENENQLSFYPKVQNLTNIIFSKDENSLLEKSLKYNINLDNKQTIIKDDLVNMDVAIKSTKQEDQEQLRFNFIHELDKNKFQFNNNKYVKKTNKDLQIINSIAKKLNENNAIITKSDKSNTTVIMNLEEYDRKVKDFLSNDKYKTLNQDPTQKYSKITNDLINKSKILKADNQHNIKMTNPKAPILRGQPKTHKEDIPIRPIVNFRRAPTYKLCKYLNNKIKNNIHWDNNYSIKNTSELVDKIKNIQIPKNCMFLSFDVKDMYSNIPIQETVQILEHDLLTSETLSKQEIKDLIKLTRNTLEQNYFEYNKIYYQQMNGLAMGSPLSGSIADIYMHYLETEKIINTKNPFHKKIVYWFRYVDDIICLFNGNEKESNDLLEYLNSISNTIQFTKESQNESINFLDVTIYKENNEHAFKIYRKSTQTDMFIHSSSNHPWQHKMAGFRSLINRLISIPMNSHNYNDEVNTIKYLAKKNGYNPTTIDKMIKKIKEKKRRQERNRQNNNTNIAKEKYICVPHNRVMNKAIRKTFENTDYKMSFRTRNNAHDIIKRKTGMLDTNINKYEKPGVYKLTCDDCDQFYIGQTRNFKLRFREHIQALKTNNKTTNKSSFAEHLLNYSHKYSNMEKNMEILHIQNKGEKLNSTEDLEIYLNYCKNQHTILNTQINTNNPIYKKISQLKNLDE